MELSAGSSNGFIKCQMFIQYQFTLYYFRAARLQQHPACHFWTGYLRRFLQYAINRIEYPRAGLGERILPELALQ